MQKPVEDYRFYYHSLVADCPETPGEVDRFYCSLCINYNPLTGKCSSYCAFKGAVFKRLGLPDEAQKTGQKSGDGEKWTIPGLLETDDLNHPARVAIWQAKKEYTHPTR